MVWKGGEMAQYGIVNKASAGRGRLGPDTGDATLVELQQIETFGENGVLHNEDCTVRIQISNIHSFKEILQGIFLHIHNHNNWVINQEQPLMTACIY